MVLTHHLSDILRERGGDYEPVVFHRDAVAWLESQLFDKRGHPYLKCLTNGQERRAYPEEIVRQLYIKKLMDEYGYPRERIQAEKGVYFGSGTDKKRADIVIAHADDPEAAYIIIEVKNPSARRVWNNCAPTATLKARPSACGPTAAKS